MSGAWPQRRGRRRGRQVSVILRPRLRWRQRSGQRQGGGAGFQAGSAAGPAERAGHRRTEPPAAPAPGRRGRGRGHRGRGGQRGPVNRPFPLGSDARRASGSAELLEVVHGLQVSLGLLEDLLGQLLGVEECSRNPFLLGLDGAVCLCAGLVRLGAAHLALSEQR